MKKKEKKNLRTPLIGPCKKIKKSPGHSVSPSQHASMCRTVEKKATPLEHETATLGHLEATLEHLAATLGHLANGVVYRFNLHT